MPLVKFPFTQHGLKNESLPWWQEWEQVQMFDPFELDCLTGIGAAKLRDMTRVTATGNKVNVHVMPPKTEPTPDFEAMRILVAGPIKNKKATEKDDRSKG